MAAPGRGRPSWVGVGGAAHPAGGRSGVGVCWGALPAQVVALRPPSARGCQHSPAAPQPHRDVAAGRGAARPSWSPERAVPLRAGGCPGPGPPSSSRGGPSVRGPEPPAELAEGSGYSVLTGGPLPGREHSGRLTSCASRRRPALGADEGCPRPWQGGRLQRVWFKGPDTSLVLLPRRSGAQGRGGRTGTHLAASPLCPKRLREALCSVLWGGASRPSVRPLPALPPVG